MTDCNLEPIRFPSCKGRLVEASFSGGAITSDGGAVLLRQTDRMLLSAMAYALLKAIRRVALAGGELARAYLGTIRLKLLKIGAVVLRNTRRTRLLLSGSFPRQTLFHAAAVKLRPG